MSYIDTEHLYTENELRQIATSYADIFTDLGVLSIEDKEIFITLWINDAKKVVTILPKNI